MKILLLAYNHPRYTDSICEWARQLRASIHEVSENGADHVYKEDVLLEFSRGYDFIIYFGHGSRAGWHGYGTIRTQDLKTVIAAQACPMVVSFSCSSLATPRRDNFCSSLLDARLAKAVVGYRKRILHTRNLQIAHQFFASFVKGEINDLNCLRRFVSTLGELSIAFAEAEKAEAA